LNEPGLRVLDVRALADYLKGHIPRAVWVNVKDWQQLGSKEGGLHDRQAWSETVGRLGVGNDTAVVVYGSSLPDAARIWWSLKYLGLPKVAILDGGWDLWTWQNRPSESGSPRVEVVKFEPEFQADRLEEMASLRRSVDSRAVTVIDARSAREFTGEEVRGDRGGHIAGAKHLEWKELLTKDGRFQSPDQLRQLFRKRGIEPDQTTVTC
jgi:thiosulfate/3-mercaptopyruvate sulfurtransferase